MVFLEPFSAYIYCKSCGYCSYCEQTPENAVYTLRGWLVHCSGCGETVLATKVPDSVVVIVEERDEED